MRDTEADIAEIINQRIPSLSPGENLFVGRVPSQAKGQAVWITTLATSVDPYLSDDDSVEVSLSVSIRGTKGRTTYSELQELAQEVWAALHRANAEPYTHILCTSLPETETDTDDAPIYSFELEVAYQASNAGGPLVILPASGPLRLTQVDLKSITFADGSILTSAPEIPDLSDYVDLNSSQNLLNKTLTSPTIAGDLMPSTAGQQSLGSAAVPWGAAFLMGQAGAVPLEIDQGAITNQRSIHIKNAGSGTTGIRYESTGGMGYWELARSGSWYQVTLANRSIRHMATGSAYDAASHTAWSYSDRVDTRVALAITGGVNPGRTADLLQLRPLESSNPSESVARIGANGEIETVAGVIIHSPNGSRFRITVADDGTLSTEPA